MLRSPINFISITSRSSEIQPLEVGGIPFPIVFPCYFIRENHGKSLKIEGPPTLRGCISELHDVIGTKFTGDLNIRI